MPFSNPQKVVSFLGLAPQMKVADFGAGSGSYAFACARYVLPKGKVYAVDIQKDLLEKIEREARLRRIDCVKTVWGDVEKKNGSHFHDEEMDAVIVSNILFQAEDKKKVLEEALRVLRKKGRIIIVDWADHSPVMGLGKEAIVSIEDVKNILEDLGGEVLYYIDAGDHHWGILAEKK